MPYAILRFKKRKGGSIASCERHNERKKDAYKSNPDIDIERSADNYHLVDPPKYTYTRQINRMIKDAGCRTRKDSVKMVETLITASPELFERMPLDEQKEFFQTALDFISEKVGKDNIISAVVHMDEKTPHMHLMFVPITPDKRLSAKEFLGNQKDLSNWQTEYHACMSKKWPELERGESSMVTHRRHVPTWELKSDEYRMEFIENRAMVRALSKKVNEQQNLLEKLPTNELRKAKQQLEKGESR